MRAALLVALLACSGCTGKPYTLYQSSVVDPSLRRDLKQYDAPRYNKENCEITRGLYFERPLGITQYLGCEPVNPTSR